MKRYRIIEHQKGDEVMYIVQKHHYDPNPFVNKWKDAYMFDTLDEAEKRIEEIKNSKRTIIKEYTW